MGLDPAERRRIAKAIWVYADRDQRSFAKDAGLTYPRFRAALADSKPAPTLEELIAMAEAAGVPRDFAIDGWAGWHDVDRVEALEQRVARLEAQLVVGDERDLESVRSMVRDILDEPDRHRRAS